MTKRGVFGLGTILGALFAVLGFAGGVAGGNFGGPYSAGAACDSTLQSQCVAQNSTHTVLYISTLDTRYRTPMDLTPGLYNEDANGLAIYLTTTFSDSNDVRVTDGDYDENGWYAWSRCVNSPAATGDNGTSADGEDLKWCKPQLIVFNDYYTDLSFHSANDLKALACHELGHTTGLRHKTQSGGTNSCMREDPTFDGDEAPAGPLMAPNGHDLDHLDFEY
jgi:hypothetical protein